MSESKRKDQKDQTRKHLLEVALHRFAQEGLMATRTSDIANEAGVSHGTVFAHFPTREELLIHVIEEFGKRINGRIHELASSGGSVREVLEAHLQGLMEFEAFYTRLVTEGPMLPLEARNTLIGIQSAISFHLLLAADAEMNDRKIRRIPLHLIFNTWLGLIHYYLANSDLFAPGESVLKRHGQELIGYFLILIAA